MKSDELNYNPLIVNQIFFSSVERKVRNYVHQIRYQKVFLLISHIHIINIGLSVIYFEKQCFLQLFGLKNTRPTCTNNRFYESQFSCKIQFF